MNMNDNERAQLNRIYLAVDRIKHALPGELAADQFGIVADSLEKIAGDLEKITVEKEL